MSDKISQNQLEVKFSAKVIECGTLDVFLSLLTSAPVLVMPLQRTRAYNNHQVHQWCVHVTACPHSFGPIFYCTFAAAELLHLGNAAQFTFPIDSHGETQRALAQGNQLQQELLDCFSTLLRQCHQVRSVVIPARYRIPDEWVWSVRTSTSSVTYRDGHYQIVREN